MRTAAEIGTRLEMFVDDTLIDSPSGAASDVGGRGGFLLCGYVVQKDRAASRAA